MFFIYRPEWVILKNILYVTKRCKVQFKETKKIRGIKTLTNTQTQTDRHRQTDTDGQTYKDRHRHIDKGRQTKTDKDKQRQTKTDTQTDIHIHPSKRGGMDGVFQMLAGLLREIS